MDYSQSMELLESSKRSFSEETWPQVWGELFENVIFFENMARLNNRGDVLFFTAVEGPDAADQVLFLNDTLLAREGEEGPIPGRHFTRFGLVDLNDQGDYVHYATLDGDTATDVIILKNGEKVVQEGDSLPDIAPWSFIQFF